MNKEIEASTNLSPYNIVANIGAVRLRTLFLLTTFLWIAIVAAQAQTVLTADQLQNGQAVEFDKLGWKYSPNDDPRFADPQFDDRAWETLNGTAITLDSIPRSGWRGLGWFRLRLQVDPALSNQPLALVMVHYGASEIYLDGKLVERFGIVSATRATEVEFNPQGRPIAITLCEPGEHVLAIRHSHALSQAKPGWMHRFFANEAGQRLSPRQIGFFLSVEAMNGAVAKHETLMRSLHTSLIFAATLFGVIGLLHLFLFFYYPVHRANLWFGLYGLSVATVILLARAHFTGTQGAEAAIIFIFNFSSVAIAAIDLCLLAFLYTQFEARLTRRFYCVALLQLFILWQYIFPFHAGFTRGMYMVGLLVIPLEQLRIIFRAIVRKEAGAIVIGISVLLYCVHPFNAFQQEISGAALPGLAAAQQFTGLMLNLLISAFLARNFARVNRNLETQLGQVMHLSVKELEHQRTEAELRVQHAQEKSENERRAKELEEARQLQLSMLPKKLPNLPHLDIAAYMKTASEVGGDYYDFHLGEDGTLTIAVGDATGHGLKAGTLVSSVKSLFVSLAYHPEISHIFQRMNRVLKEMNLRGLFMAMTMVKVKGNQMSVSIAGMPSVLIYRALSGEVEEVVMRALPLGGMAKYQYQQRELTLATDDVVVLMSDGLPERFNPNDEMLEDERIHQALPVLANQSAAQIIAALVQLGDTWSEGRPQDDDITFVVLKIR